VLTLPDLIHLLRALDCIRLAITKNLVMCRVIVYYWMYYTIHCFDSGCEDRLRNDLYCVGWGVKLCSLTHSLTAL